MISVFNKISLLYLLLLCYTGTSQYQNICFKKLNMVDSFIFLRDTSSAIKIFLDIDHCDIQISTARRLKMSGILNKRGYNSSAIWNLEKACSEGLLQTRKSKDLWKLVEHIEEIGGEEFAYKLLKEYRRNRSKIYNKNEKLLIKLNQIVIQDEKLRRNSYYSKCRSLMSPFSNKKVDSTLNIGDLIACKNEFRLKDSINLQKFVNIIDSIGCVPNSKELFFQEFPVLICHTSHYKFKEKLDSIYLHSVEIGNISPKLYGWYVGYKEEWYNLEFTYYYTHGEKRLKMNSKSTTEIAKINSRRYKIGLPSLPASIWTNGVW